MKPSEIDELVRSKVDSLQNLSPEQRESVFNIARAHACNTGEHPAYENIARLVRNRKQLVGSRP